MPKTAYQKIIDAHIKKTLPDGRMVLGLDWVWGHEITTPNAILDAKSKNLDIVFDPNKIKIMIDHVSPAKDTASAVQGQIVREWSQKHGLEFLDIGNNGVCHAIIPEKGWIRPGQIGVMGDSHTCTHGAFCALTAGVGTTDFEAGVITSLWIAPPQKVIRVNFTGKLPNNVFAKDLILTLIKQIGVKGATNSVIEFGGEIVDKMSMEARMTLTNMAIEAGGTSGMVNVDDATINYLWPVLKMDLAFWRTFSSNSAGLTHRTSQYGSLHSSNSSQISSKNLSPEDEKKYKQIVLKELSKWNSDEGCEYAQVINIDVTNLEPVVTVKYTPEDVVEAKVMEGTKINQVYIGSCTNGRIEDLRIAATIFKQKKQKIADNVRCIIVPATQNIYNQAMREGLLEVFTNVGCFIGGPSCGACLGMSCGVIAPGEVCVSTTNRNFRGRMGRDGMVHLASPATAAFSALAGSIQTPPVDFDYSIKSHDISAQDSGWQQKEVKKHNYKELAKGQTQTQKDFSGKVFYLNLDNVDTDQIFPARYMNEVDKKKFGEYCLEDAPIKKEDSANLKDAKIIVAGENFGCGSSREHAVWTLEESGINVVIAPSFARIFYNNMFNNGLLAIELPQSEIDKILQTKPEELEINIEKNEIVFINGSDKENKCKVVINFELSDYQKQLIQDGGSIGTILKIAGEVL